MVFGETVELNKLESMDDWMHSLHFAVHKLYGRLRTSALEKMGVGYS
jgi:hypothetical protein